jgi:hypothetical protein
MSVPKPLPVMVMVPLRTGEAEVGLIDVTEGETIDGS